MRTGLRGRYEGNQFLYPGNQTAAACDLSAQRQRRREESETEGAVRSELDNLDTAD